MNQRTLERIGRQAVKAGTRKAEKVHHPLDREEILALRVQIIPMLPRILVGLAGASLIAAGAAGWPWDGNGAQALLVILGILLGLFAIFGVRRTLETMGDSMGNQAIEVIVELVARAAGAVIDL